MLMHPPRRRIALGLGLVLGFLGAVGPVGRLHAQVATELVEWALEARPSPVAPGEAVEVMLDGSIAEGWKMYALDSPRPSLALRVGFEDVPAVLAQRGELRQKEPTEAYDENFGIDVRYFEEQALVEATFDVDAEAEPGRYPVEAAVRFQICDVRICLPPTSVTVAATVTVAEEGGKEPAREERSDAETPLVVPDAELRPPIDDDAESDADLSFTPADDLGTAQAGGFGGFLLLAIGAGLASLLMPCVFPMIPLTVSYFTKHTRTRGEAARMASVYGASIVLTFTGLGVLMALLVGAAGAQMVASNPWVNLFIGLVFIVFALSLLGLFELRLPTGLVNYVNRQGQERRGYTGVLFMGFTLTLVSFSCTAPFVGGLLAATAQGRWFYPLLGMLVFSATFALPFVLLALFPKGLQALPRSGQWMNVLKVTLGFVELAAALKFLSNADLVWGWNVLSRPLALALSIALFALTGLYLIGKLRLAHEAPAEHIGVGRLLGAIAFFGLSLYLVPGLFGAPLGLLDAYLPPRQASDPALVGAGLTFEAAADPFTWHENTEGLETAFEEAREKAMPVFVDFTGYTCTNCRAMETNVFPKPAVAERLERDFVRLRLWTDDPEHDEALQRYQLQLTGTTALPTYAIVHPNGQTLIARHTGTASVDEFAAFLAKGASRFAERSLARR